MTNLNRQPGRLVATFVVLLALVAGACGDDGDSATEQTTTTTTTTTTTEAPVDGEAESEVEDEVVLTDSAPGVTATTIRIGVPSVDTTQIGWDPSHDSAAIWQVAAETINANGGVLGRDVEVVIESVSPIDFLAQDEICVRFTEDDPVFVAMGVIRENAPLCYTEVHSTNVINTFATLAEIYERSTNATLIGFLPLLDRSSAAQLQVLIDSGRLEGRKVALSSAPDTLETAESMRDSLEAAGIEVVSITNFESPSSDRSAIDREMDVRYEIWRDAGADTIIPVPGVSVPTTGALSRNGFDGLYVVTDSPGTDIGLLDGFGYGSEALVGSIAVVTPAEADLYEAGQAGVDVCVDTFDDAFDDDAPVVIRPEDQTTDVVGVIVRSCQALELFKAVAELAGPDLTNESFAAAADAIGEFTVTGVLAGSLGPGKRDYVDAAAALYEFDETLGRFVLA